MPAVIERYLCQECKQSHDLCRRDVDLLDLSREYEYLCPVTGKIVPLLAAKHFRFGQVPPKGYVEIRDVGETITLRPRHTER